MDSAVSDVVHNYQILLQEWTKKPPNLDKCGQILEKLKVALTQMTFFAYKR